MPLFTAIGTAIATGFSVASTWIASAGIFGTLAKSVLSLGLSFGLNALARAGQNSKKTTSTEPATILSSQIQLGGNIPRQVVFGQAATQGQLVNGWTTGQANSLMVHSIVLSEGHCDGIEEIWINGKKQVIEVLTPTHGEHIRLTTETYILNGGIGTQWIEFRFWDGRPDQSGPSSYLNSIGITDLSTDDRGFGMFHCIMTVYNYNNFWPAVPEVLYVPRGYRCYDPRLDDTAGGTGDHRWDDPSTWEFSRNPAIQALNYMLGIYGQGHLLLGMSVPLPDILLEYVIEAANVCDESVSLTGGGTEPRYRCDIVITAEEGQEHRAALAPMIEAMGGNLLELGGEFGLLAGAAQASVITLTDDDVIWKGLKWAASSTRTERVNEVHGQFIDPSGTYEANSYQRIINEDAIAYDGESLVATKSFRAVQSSTQAQRLASILLNSSRFEANGTMLLPHKLMHLEAGDWFTWTSARYNTSRVYRIEEWRRLRDNTTRIGFKEVSSAIYGTDAIILTPTPLPGIGSEPDAGASTVTGLAVQADVAPGTSRPIVIVSWDPPEDERIVAVIIEYRPVGATNWTRVRDDSPEDGSFVIDQPATGTNYEYRATIRTEPPRPTTYTGTVTLEIEGGDIPLDQLALDARTFLLSLRAQIDTLRDQLNGLAWSSNESISINRTSVIDIGSSLGDAQATITEVAFTAATTEAALASLTTSVSAQFGTVNTALATVTSTTETLATETAALASEVDVIDARLGSNMGNISETLEALAKGDFVAALAELAVSANAGEILTAGRFKITSVADGALGTGGTQFAIEVEANTGGAYSVAAMFLEAWVDAGISKSRIKLVADQFRLELPNGDDVMYYDPGTDRVVFDNVQIDGDLIRASLGIETDETPFTHFRGSGHASIPNNTADNNTIVTVTSRATITNSTSSIMQVDAYWSGDYEIAGGDGTGFVSYTYLELYAQVDGSNILFLSDDVNGAIPAVYKSASFFEQQTRFLQPSETIDIEFAAKIYRINNGSLPVTYANINPGKIIVRTSLI